MTKNTFYESFIDKFKPKLTTDDCYTPPEVYDEVLHFVKAIPCAQNRPIVRPFFPGGDYENFGYPENCIVVDNPPFSIYAKIVRFYLEKNIDFFLFAPTLTQAVYGADVCYVVTASEVVFHNGAKISISFTTTLIDDYRIVTEPALAKRIEAAQKTTEKKNAAKYKFHQNVMTIARLHKSVTKGMDLRIKAEDCRYIRKLDNGHKFFGMGFLLSDSAAAEKAAAEKAAEKGIINIQLSPRELEIIREMNNGKNHG
ncbi:chromosome partitioning protein ParB [Bacteroides heparinolyticus]|uniref:chromosome partitioning protein ParB n=1 Tax=Prevotella heparinolytica TaxID=28113 RepID=UPI0035A116C7